MIFWLLWGFDALIGAVIVYFFVSGLAKGSVSSFNMGLWLALLLGLAGILGGGLALRAAGRASVAIPLLLLLAVPAVLAGVLLVAALILKPRWN